MNRQDMFEREQRLSRTAVERDLAQLAKENRGRWAGWRFRDVDPAELPGDDALVVFATTDAATVAGVVRAGTFLVVPAPLTSRFQVSRTFLPASREALRRLTALRDELLAAGQTAQAEAVDLRPVRPLGEPPAERREPERLADGGER